MSKTKQAVILGLAIFLGFCAFAAIYAMGYATGVIQ